MGQGDDELTNILEESPEDVNYKVGFDDRITYVSPSVKDLFGYEPGELIGINVKQVLTPQSYLKQREGMERAMGENSTKTDILMVEVIKKNGEKVPVEICARFDRDADGNMVGILGTAKVVKITF